MPLTPKPKMAKTPPSDSSKKRADGRARSKPARPAASSKSPVRKDVPENPSGSAAVLRKLAARASRLLKHDGDGRGTAEPRKEQPSAPAPLAEEPKPLQPRVHTPVRVPSWLDKQPEAAPPASKKSSQEKSPGASKPAKSSSTPRRGTVKRPDRVPTWTGRKKADKPARPGLVRVYTPPPAAVKEESSAPIMPFAAAKPRKASGASSKQSTDTVPDTITLMVKDPWWLYAYWSIRPERERSVRSQLLPQEIEGLRIVLRVFDVTEAGARTFDIGVSSLATKWYVPVNTPGRRFRVELGLLTKSGRFLTLAKSNEVTTPRFGPSESDKDKWAVSDADYWRLFGVTAGFGAAADPQELKKLFERQLSSGGLSSPGVFSPGFSPGGAAVASKDFGLWVNTELILYGGTDPKAKVTVQGQAVALRPDGTFAMRFILPDGTQMLPVQAVSSDGTQTRGVALRVVRESSVGQSDSQGTVRPTKDASPKQTV